MRNKYLRFIPFFLFGIIFFSCGGGFRAKKSSLSMSGENLIALNPVSVKAQIKDTNKSSYMFFKFTENQKAHFSNMCKKNCGASLSVTFSFSHKKGLSEMPFFLGFIFDEDFSSDTTLNESILARKLITGNFTECESEEFTLLFSVPQNSTIPSGFFIYGTEPFKITCAKLDEAKIGWEKGDVPLFAFGPSGGKVSWDFSFADFKGSQFLFPDQNLPTRIMPVLEIDFEPQAEIGKTKMQKKIGVTLNSDTSLSLRLSKNESTKTLQSSAFAFPIEKVSLTENKELVKSVILKNNPSSFAQDLEGKVLFPLKTDLGLVMDWPVKNWRRPDYEIFQWEMFPDVIFFDFIDYETQNLFFTRMAYFVEKAGYRGTFVSDDFIKENHGYNAHDYRAQDMAEFFSKAKKEGFKLNRQELILREILLSNGIILENDSGYSSGKGAVVSFSRESQPYLRRTFLSHESWHGVYFTDEAFRNEVASIYNSFDPLSLDFIQTFWETQSGLGYDRRDEYLMQNEFMAYIMQQPVMNVQEYFLQLAGRSSVNRIQGESAAYIRLTEARAFLEAAEKLDQYAFEKWGLASGRVSLVSR